MNARLASFMLALLSLACCLPAVSRAQNLYWDTNSGTGGIQGGDGTWDSSSFWNNSSTGSGSFSGWTSGANANFSVSSSTVDLEATTWTVGNLAWTGGITVSLTNGGGLNLGGGLTNSNSNAASTLTGPLTLTAAQAFNLNGSGISNVGGSLATGTHALAINSTGNNRVNITANLTGSADITISTDQAVGAVANANRLVQFTGANTDFTGDYILAKGVMGFYNVGAGYTNKNVIQFGETADSKEFNVFTGSVTLGGLNSNGGAGAEYFSRGNHSSNSLLTIDTSVTGGGFDFAGIIRQLDPARLLSVTKTGAGTQTLSGANTFSGTMTVSAGTLAVPTINNASENGPLGNRAGPVLLGSSGTTGTLEYTGGTASSDKPFTAVAGGTAAFSVTEAAAVLTLSGAIDGTGHKSFGGAGSTIVSGAISGGNVFKTGGGTLTLENLNGQANTTVNDGQLNINQFAALGISTGTLTMAAGTSLDNTSGAPITITNPKSIALGNSLTFVGTGDLDLGEGTTTLSDTTTFTVSAGTLTLSGDVVGAGFGIVKEGAGTLRLDGLSGTGSFTGNSTINAGTLLLEGSSTLGGTAGTTVTLGANGFLEVGASASLGDVTVAGVTGNLITNSPVNANQDFTVSQTLSTANGRYNGVQMIGSGVTVTTAANYLGTIPSSATAGRIVFENGSTLAATAGFSIDPNQGVSLDAGTATVSVAGGQAVFFESAIAGSGGLTKTGAGNLRLTGSNTYQGGTVIDQGILGISSGAALGDVSGSLSIDGTILAAATNPDGSGGGATIDAARTVLIGNGKTSGLHAQNGLTLRYDGAIGEIDSQGAAGSLQFGLAGPREGIVILGGANTYRGDTILSAGTLKLGSGGSFADSPTIVVGDAGGSSAAVLDLTDKSSFAIGAGQTLKGKGTVLLGASTALTINGLLSPGNSPGLLTYDGGGTVTLSGTTLIEITGGTRGADPGYDAIDLRNGTDLSFGGVLNLDFSQTFSDGASFNLFTPDETSSLLSTFSSIAMVGSAYSDLTFTQDGTSGLWTTNTGAANQSMTFDSSTGSLAIVAVPEPAGLALAALGLVMGLSRRLRRGR